MKKFICPVCKKNTQIALYPDHSSSGMWCNNCGVGFGDPIESFPEIPKDLVYAIDGWNSYWSFYYTYRKDLYGFKYFKQNFIAMGKILAKELEKYYPCVKKVDRYFWS